MSEKNRLYLRTKLELEKLKSSVTDGGSHCCVFNVERRNLPVLPRVHDWKTFGRFLSNPLKIIFCSFGEAPKKFYGYSALDEVLCLLDSVQIVFEVHVTDSRSFSDFCTTMYEFWVNARNPVDNYSRNQVRITWNTRISFTSKVLSSLSLVS